ncbi:angiopoietin-related protein 1 [Elysia marginata]|uniref:Angiopoietin-related protein 1 n=1 Tax=Elysia marginata TaxID=1093978 RepID=A0AAV4ILK2_9GAST|nr:angiopoietin-related protein 1 [Elysia marginata]
MRLLLASGAKLSCLVPPSLLIAKRYKLILSGTSSGNLEEGGPNDKGLIYNNGRGFTATGTDNDQCSCDCAVRHKSGWWHKSCTKVNLNGKWNRENLEGMFWRRSARAFRYGLSESRMMMRKH